MLIMTQNKKNLINLDSLGFLSKKQYADMASTSNCDM